MTAPLFVYKGPELAAYGFGNDHPFGLDRHDVFHTALDAAALGPAVSYAAPKSARRDVLELFHTATYIDKVQRLSVSGTGWLDAGDTPAFAGVYEAASAVVGTTLAAVEAVMTHDCRHAFVPIAGLHHARRDGAAGFCVFNDCGVAIEYLRRDHGLHRVAYVDIDAHHGDGVFYGFEDDPDLIFADIHEDGRFLYPGTGHENETGRGEATGTKLNLPLAPGANDAEFKRAWSRVESYLEDAAPEFIIFQCGADSVGGDPITHLEFTSAAHAQAARSLKKIAARHCDGRLVATGGGGYNRANIAAAWTEVVRALAS